MEGGKARDKGSGEKEVRVGERQVGDRRGGSLNRHSLQKQGTV